MYGRSGFIDWATGYNGFPADQVAAIFGRSREGKYVRPGLADYYRHALELRNQARSAGSRTAGSMRTGI